MEELVGLFFGGAVLGLAEGCRVFGDEIRGARRGELFWEFVVERTGFVLLVHPGHLLLLEALGGLLVDHRRNGFFFGDGRWKVQGCLDDVRQLLHFYVEFLYF